MMLWGRREYSNKMGAKAGQLWKMTEVAFWLESAQMCHCRFSYHVFALRREKARLNQRQGERLKKQKAPDHPLIGFHTPPLKANNMMQWSNYIIRI